MTSAFLQMLTNTSKCESVRYIITENAENKLTSVHSSESTRGIQTNHRLK